ncbi:MAG: sporulation protein YunB [Acutalibacteraceae bacterium]|nr:sporulation protein YunB [Acutalibacteraceae bacterium]
MKYGYYYRRRKTVIFRIVCIFLAILTSVLLADAKLRPAIYDLAAVEAKSVAVKTIHTAVERVLAKSSVSYADIVSISRNNSGSITGITTDIVKLNLFKSQITNAVDDEFIFKGSTKVSVPLGSVSGITFLSGCGPYVDVKISMLSSTQSDFENKFESAGINQTQHSVILDLDTQVILTMSGRRITTDVKTSFCVAQTVIVGTVPNVMVE